MFRNAALSRAFAMFAPEAPSRMGSGCGHMMSRATILKCASIDCAVLEGLRLQINVRRSVAKRDQFLPPTISLTWITGVRSVWVGMSARISFACGPKPAWNASGVSQARLRGSRRLLSNQLAYVLDHFGISECRYVTGIVAARDRGQHSAHDLA